MTERTRCLAAVSLVAFIAVRTSAVLEETLHGSMRAANSMSRVKADPNVGEYQEQL